MTNFASVNVFSHMTPRRFTGVNDTVDAGIHMLHLHLLHLKKRTVVCNVNEGEKKRMNDTYQRMRYSMYCNSST